MGETRIVVERTVSTCEDCLGTGETVDGESCWFCHGEGLIIDRAVIDPDDPALIERLAIAMSADPFGWDELAEEWREDYREKVRDVLAEMQQTPSPAHG